MSDSDDADPSATMRGRAQESRAKLWVLMNADRWIIAAGLAVLVFVALVGTSFLNLAPLRRVVSAKNALWWFFSPMVGGVTTGVTLVVTFNQLVLSQEQGPLGDQRERMRGAMDFREEVESWLDAAVSPPDPASFLEALLDGLQTQANDFEGAVEGSAASDEFKSRAEEFVGKLTDHAQAVGDELSDAQFGEFDVLMSALNFNYSWKLYQGRRLKSEHADDIDDDVEDALDEVIEVLKFFGPAREHIKTLYFQWELVNLSRVLLYTAVPALLTTVLVMFYVDTQAIVGSTFGVDHLVWLLAAATTVTLLPFFFIISYILRIATIAKRTLAIGPFILRETDRSEDITWD